jgi:putative oxidoreductase
MLMTFLSKYADFALLFLRVGLGAMFIFYGKPMLLAGPKKWQQIGQAMAGFGIHFLPVFWGFMAAFAEFFGGICLILGLIFKPMCLLLFITMVVAVRMHFKNGEKLIAASHALEDSLIFLALIFIGPGKYSLDWWLNSIIMPLK